jgi:type I restriction enzyme S subunit
LVPLSDLLLESQNGLSKRHGEGVPVAVLRLADILDGQIEESSPRTINLSGREIAKYGLQQGDLVCIRVNGSKALVGRVIPFKSAKQWAYCDHFIRFRPKHEVVDFRYLTHFFSTQAVRRHVELNMVSSAGQNTVSQGTMLSISVPLPPLARQREIVAEIEKQFSRLDEAVANLQRVKANLKRYKASVLKAAVEGRLVETEASLARREGRTYETGEQLLQRILEERRSKWAGRGKYKEPLPPVSVGFNSPAAGWVWASGDQLTSVITDGEHITPRRTSEGVLLLSARNVLNGRLALDDVDYVPEDEYERIAKRIAIQAGDVLLSCSGTVGRSCVVPAGLRFTLVRSVAVLRPIIMLADFMTYNLQSPLGQSQIDDRKTQTAQANLFQGKIRQLVFALPPLAEQARIVAEVDRHLSIVREVESEVNNNLQRAQALRQATLVKAFSV